MQPKVISDQDRELRILYHTNRDEFVKRVREIMSQYVKTRAILSTEDKKALDKIGTYRMETGGGTPIPKGKKMKDMEGTEGFHRVDQPRDEEGRFAHNSVNALELKYEPRQKTIPAPFREMDLKYVTKGKQLIVGENEKIWESKISMTKQEFIDVFKIYQGPEEGFSAAERGIQLSRKKGRQSNYEKRVIEDNLRGIIAVKKDKKYKPTIKYAA